MIWRSLQPQVYHAWYEKNSVTNNIIWERDEFSQLSVCVVLGFFDVILWCAGRIFWKRWKGNSRFVEVSPYQSWRQGSGIRVSAPSTVDNERTRGRLMATWHRSAGGPPVSDSITTNTSSPLQSDAPADAPAAALLPALAISDHRTHLSTLDSKPLRGPNYLRWLFNSRTVVLYHSFHINGVTFTDIFKHTGFSTESRAL